MLHFQSQNAASRTPYIFYNTWNFQERNNAWNGRPYLESMNQDRILKEVDAAHRMGIDVFVLDTGWYERTGDWQVSRARFPDGLAGVRARLRSHEMQLGVWLSPTQAAVSSRAGQECLDCRIEWDGTSPGPYPVWETEVSWNMCLVSRYWEAFADEMIRLARELGVTYFKWDAIGQYGCNSAGHYHGGERDSASNRADRYAFELPRYLAKVVNKVSRACPGVIVDFDITEGGRSVGLGYLEAGKYFLINNGPYFRSLDFPADTTNLGMFWNVFVYPGPARAQLCRVGLEYDAWIPSVLFLTHYLPDPPESSQWINLASLILGQNGIWGDLLGLFETDLDRFGEVLAVYKTVREDITAAYPVVTGRRGGSPEIYEKINPANGRGVVVVFAGAGGHFTYVSQSQAAPLLWRSQNCTVTILASGQARIDLEMAKQSAAFVFFG
jgi:alpha-galactosidase